MFKHDPRYDIYVYRYAWIYRDWLILMYSHTHFGRWPWCWLILICLLQRWSSHKSNEQHSLNIIFPMSLHNFSNWTSWYMVNIPLFTWVLYIPNGGCSTTTKRCSQVDAWRISRWSYSMCHLSALHTSAWSRCLGGRFHLKGRFHLDILLMEEIPNNHLWDV